MIVFFGGFDIIGGEEKCSRQGMPEKTQEKIRRRS
jgi:hypothetical protein